MAYLAFAAATAATAEIAAQQQQQQHQTAAAALANVVEPTANGLGSGASEHQLHKLELNRGLELNK